jgi:predicted Abi (CAAX) family protease
LEKIAVGQLVWRRLTLALATWPTAAGWGFAAAALAAFVVTALPLGLASGVLIFGRAEPWPRLAAFAAVAIMVPCLAEELVFRAALLPQPSENGGRLIPAVAAVAAFTLWHPLNAALFLPGAWPLFADARFVLLTALLGVSCTAVYLRSGSVWPGVAIHWVVVMAWKAWLGGPLVVFGTRP